MSDERKELVEIDLTGVTSARQLHNLLLQSLDFPAWYGCNWNAFWDAITGIVEMPKTLRLRGWKTLTERLPDDARIMRNCLDDLATQYPNSAAEIEYV